LASYWGASWSWYKRLGCLLELVQEAATPRDSGNYGLELNEHASCQASLVYAPNSVRRQLERLGMDDEVNESAGNDLAGSPRGVSQ
jgi:hypothetical protein